MSNEVYVDLEALRARGPEQDRRYEKFRGESLALDMTRGKPSPEQLDLSLEMLTIVGPEDFRSESGVDCRNYGGVEGLPEAKAFFAAFLGAAPDEVLIGDNASLALMHDAVARALSHGVPGGAGPWAAEGPVRFLCPAPGYDRHFGICEHSGIEMLNVEMTDTGPDMDAVERLAGEDPRVKGIWVVPRYSNPTGVTLPEAVVERFARMSTAAPDFRILWDNAYAVHHLTDDPAPLIDLLAACKAAGHPDRPWMFGSTSKISFAGAGLAAMAASEANVAWMRKHRSVQTIGPDKLNQLRHVRFLRDMEGLRAHMQRHAALIRPKFETVLQILSEELDGTGLASWTRPEGGYFISLDTLEGCAKTVVAMAAETGVKLTQAGATFPYGKDPRDRNIRIAPTLPALPEIETATRVLCCCIKRASLAQLTARG